MIWYGNKSDTSDFVSQKYLKINNCGVQNAAVDLTVIREKGRSDYHILFITDGTATVTHSGKEHKLTSGGVAVYFPHEEQRYSLNKGAASLWCHFSGTAIDELMSTAGITSGIYNLRQSDAAWIAFHKMIQLFHIKGREERAIPHLLELVYGIADGQDAKDKTPVSDMVSACMLYIHRHYNEKITLDELASVAGYSKSRFSHLFSSQVGIAPKAYQNNVRLTVSCEMLLTTGKTVAEIALLCGFDDPLYYSRQFKKKYNVSPTDYRHRGGDLY